MENKVRILIADDHLLVAKLISMDLRFIDNYEVAAILDDGDKVEEYLRNNLINILLLDLNMPTVDGLTVLSHIRGKYPDLKIIIISTQCEGNIVKKSIELGANGYLSKNSDPEEIKLGISTVLSGEPYFCKRSLKSFYKSMANTGDNSSIIKDEKNNQITLKDIKSKTEQISKANLHYDNTLLSTLTTREKEILDYILEEFTSREISEKLFISYRTVETHRKHILTKLGAKSTLSLMKHISENNL